MKDYLRIDGKVAIVTGSGRGIGRGIALALASYGVKVMVTDINDENGNNVKKEIIDAGGVAEYCHCDVCRIEDIKNLVAATVKAFGTVDILVNNAGITKDGLLMKMSEEDFSRVVDTNLKGTFNCIRHVSRMMLKQRSGQIISLSSVVGLRGNAGQANYAASKAGIIGLTKSAAKELASRGITVNAIAPGFIKTDMTDVLSDKVKENIAASIPMGSMGTTEDVAKAAAFLASDGARYITGQVLRVDGGMAM